MRQQADQQTCASTNTAFQNYRAGAVCGLLAGVASAAGVVSAAGVAPSDGGTTTGAAAPCGAIDGEAVGIGDAVDSGTPPSNTDRLSPIPSESVNATNMKVIAAPMVILANKVCVPRGPKAVLDTELVKSAPASALPG